MSVISPYTIRSQFIGWQKTSIEDGLSIDGIEDAERQMEDEMKNFGMIPNGAPSIIPDKNGYGVLLIQTFVDPELIKENNAPE